MIGRVNTGGGTGGTLTVTTPGAGITVTATKDGKTKTKVSGADGTAVFKGLEGGTWRVTITNGSQTAQKTVAVTTDYAVALTFFAATINVTYPAGSVCTATDGVTTITAPDTSGTWACIVPNAGTWTVTATDGTNVRSVNVTIETDGQTLSIELNYRFYLFREGQGMQNSFQFVSASSYTSLDNSKITYNSNCQIWGGFQIKPNIDMSIYKSICFDVDVEATWLSGSYSLVYGVGAYVSSDFDDENQGTWAAKATSTVAGNQDRLVYRVDLSGVESTQYVKFVSRGTQGYVYNIWLE